MTAQIKRTATTYRNIYFNEHTQKYDIKFNFTVPNPETGGSKYKQKWIYGIPSISEAKEELGRMRTEYKRSGSSDVTLLDAFRMWEQKAIANNYSPITIKNTGEHFRIICRIFPEDTKISSIRDTDYYDFTTRCRSLGYSNETILIINATFRKFINLCYRKRLIDENFLTYCDNIRLAPKSDYRVISRNTYKILDEFFAGGTGSEPAVCRLLAALLYYSGIRIGEALALTYEDFESCTYTYQGMPVKGMRLKVCKSYVSKLKITKETKNYKNRSIPLHAHVVSLFEQYRDRHLKNGGQLTDRVITLSYSPLDKCIKKACRILGLPAYHFHEFRHTFISYLISKNVPISVIEKVSGDTQQTILTRYSHCFEDAEVIVWAALNEI